jgi:hypothetical protein
MAIKTAFFSAILALASVSGLFLSPEPLTHNQAVMFCATNGARLADVTSASLEHVKHELNGRAVWIGSWDYNYYNNACMEFVNGHIGAIDCGEKLVAACNNRAILKSTNEEQQGEVDEGHKYGARTSRRPHPKPCESSSSSSSSCLSSGPACAAECAYQYVYLTNTVTNVFTSVSSVFSITSTITETEFFATVAAYTVVPIP